MPYKIDLYRHQVAGIDENGDYLYTDYLYATKTHYDYYDGGFHAEGKDLVFRYVNGEYVMEEPFAQYYIVVTDSNGQTKTSEILQDMDW